MGGGGRGGDERVFTLLKSGFEMLALQMARKGVLFTSTEGGARIPPLSYSYSPFVVFISECPARAVSISRYLLPYEL